MNHSPTIQDSVAGPPSPALAGLSAWAGTARRRAQGGLADCCLAQPLDVLSARFRVIRRMVGEPSFRRAASRYIAREPPQFPLPRSYGETFPAFVRTQGSGGSFDYVADIAELEVAVSRARDAVHAPALDGKALAPLRSVQPARLCVALHPSVSLVQSRFPIVTIFENNQSGRIGTIDRWRPEAALVARPFRKVEITRLPPGGYAFLQALAQGQTVAAAIRCATATAVEFEPASNLALVEKASLVVGLWAVASCNPTGGER